ncbi:MAG TPA: glycosyltransferase 87 family protein [Mycobacteriales bacterium]|nr:glycosyltransferase 87 family protein [Mycobacteriales bacterium]
MSHGRKPSTRVLISPFVGVGPLAAATMFVGGCLLVVLVLATRPMSWRTIDLEVYRSGASALLHGRDVYAAHPGDSHLPFSYPPFAALSFVPMALLGQIASRAVLTALSAAALVLCLGLSVQAVRPGWRVRSRWTVALLVGTAALFTDPVYWTLAFGQVNLLLVALVLLDLLGGRTGLPRGVLIGVATAVKLTPGLFVVYLALTRRMRAAVTAATVLAASMAVGFLVAPGPSLEYWGRLVFDPGRGGGREFIDNQSLRGAAIRLAGAVGSTPVGWAVPAVLTLVVGMWFAVRAGRRPDDLLGVSLCAVTGLLVWPVSSNHYWVWALPVAVVLWARCLDLRAPARVAVAAGWTAVFCLAPIWWVPYRHGLKFTLHGGQLLAGNAYVLAGLALLAGAPLLVRSALPSRGTGQPVAPEPRAEPDLQNAASQT